MLTVPPIAEVVHLYKSTSKPDRIRAGRIVGIMNPDQISELKRTLEHQHVPIHGRLAKALKDPVAQAEHVAKVEKQEANGNGSCNVKKVFWGEDEWEFLVTRVSALCLKEPTTGIANLAARIMKMMPEEQRRPTHAGLVSELNKRLIEYNRTKWLEIDQELQAAKHELERRKAQPTREEVLSSLTKEELDGLTQQVVDNLSPHDLVSRFSEQTILDCISTEAVIANAFVKVCSNAGQHTRLLEENLTMLSRLLAEMPQEKIRRQLQEKAAPARLPQVAFVGFKADQIAIVADSLRGRIRLDVIDKNRSTFESQADIIILWTKFISHSFQTQVTLNMKKGARLIRFNGGLETAAREIERALTI
jgi:hypothetical protein